MKKIIEFFKSKKVDQLLFLNQEDTLFDKGYFALMLLCVAIVIVAQVLISWSL